MAEIGLTQGQSEWTLNNEDVGMTKIYPKLLVLCTVSTGIDAIAEVHRRGYPIEGLVGLMPEAADPKLISGYTDIQEFAKVINVKSYYSETYSLASSADQALMTGLDFDLIWVCGWQRLVPSWLIELSHLGVLGGHGSPDGIAGGRGRSPQNWALLLGSSQFDMALFLITKGIDDGPIISRRTFYYRPYDDIQVSYYRASLAMADMVCEVLDSPEKIANAQRQASLGFYYPQRRPEDGSIDWYQPMEFISRQCRALTSPYPGLRSTINGVTVTITQCQPFDDLLDGVPGQISHCFYAGDFLVNVLDGRILVRGWEASDDSWIPRSKMRFVSVSWRKQLEVIVQRHMKKNRDQPISPRILRHL